MPVSPNDALALSSSEKGIISKLSAAIDDILKRDFTGSIVTIEEKKITSVGISVRVFSGLRDEYNKAGWDVTRRSEQRDGAYLEFSPIKSK